VGHSPEGCGGCALSLAKKEKLVVRSQALRLFLKSVLGGLEPESRWGTISIRSEHGGASMVPAP